MIMPAGQDMASMVSGFPAAEQEPDSIAPLHKVEAAPIPKPTSMFKELSGENGKELRELTIERLIKKWDAYDAYYTAEVEPILAAVYRAYRGYKPVNTGPYKTHYAIREIFRQIETLKPQVIRQFLGGEQLFRYAPKHAGGEDKAQAATDIVHTQIIRHEIDSELTSWLENTLLYGTSYLHYGWRKYKFPKRKISPIHAPKDKSWWNRTTTEEIEEAPVMQNFNAWQVRTHPSIEDPRKSPAVFIREVVSPDDLKTLIRSGWIDEKLTRAAVESKGTGAGRTALEELRPPGISENDVNDLDCSLEGDEPLEMLTCYTNNGMEYVILNREHLVRSAKCPYGEIPLIALRNYPQKDEHYGLPEPLIILDDQRILNDFMSMYVDTIHYVLNPMWKVKVGAASKNWDLNVFRPGGKVVVNDMGDVEPLQVNPATMNIQQAGQFVLQMMKLSSGVTDELAGAGSDQRTATGLVTLKDAAGARMEHKVKMFMPRFRRTYTVLHNLNAMYLNDAQAIRMEGDDGQVAFKVHNPDVFSADVDVTVELANVMETGPEAANKWQNLYKMVGQDPMVDKSMVLQRMFRAMGEKKPKLFLVNPVTAQGDALAETRQVQQYGFLPEPKPSDNHQVHFDIHQMALQDQTLGEIARNALMSHIAVHQAYLEQMQQQNAQAQQTPTTPEGQGAVMPQANDRANAIFNMDMTGAAQAGSLPGGMQ